jgi:hypothetical protein
MSTRRYKRRNSTVNYTNERVVDSTNSLSGVGGVEWVNENENQPPLQHEETHMETDNNDVGTSSDEESHYEDAESGSLFSAEDVNNNTIDINYNDNDNELNIDNDNDVNDNNIDINYNDNDNENKNENNINNIDINYNDDDNTTNNNNNNDNDNTNEHDNTNHEHDNNNDNDNNNNNNNVNNNQRNNHVVTLESCRDNIISASTLKSYVGDTIRLCRWITDVHPEWFTPYGSRCFADLYAARINEKKFDHRLRMTTSVTELIRNAGTNPFLNIDLFTASEYMKYLVKVKKETIPTTYHQVPTGTKGQRCITFFVSTTEPDIAKYFVGNLVTYVVGFTGRLLSIDRTVGLIKKERSQCRRNFIKLFVVGYSIMVHVTDYSRMRI